MRIKDPKIVTKFLENITWFPHFCLLLINHGNSNYNITIILLDLYIAPGTTHWSNCCFFKKPIVKSAFFKLVLSALAFLAILAAFSMLLLHVSIQRHSLFLPWQNRGWDHKVSKIFCKEVQVYRIRRLSIVFSVDE